MICTRKYSLSNVYTILMITIQLQQEVRSYHRKHHVHQFRHHHIPSKQECAFNMRTSLNQNSNLLLQTKLPLNKSDILLKPRHTITFSSTLRPYQRKKLDVIEQHISSNLQHRKTLSPPEINTFRSLVQGTGRLQQNNLPRKQRHYLKNLQELQDEDDEYYYDEEDDISTEEDEKIQSIVTRHPAYMIPLHVDAISNKSYGEGTLKQLKAQFHQKDIGAGVTLTEHRDDYSYEYVDDEPSNNTDDTVSLTDEKWRNYGTVEAVEKSRKKYLSQAHLVSEHITRVHIYAMCKHPRPKIIQISEASKRFVPHCTVLHRCGDDTGCCHSDTQTCVPKKTSNVDLYFYVIPLGMKDPVVEVLSLINHTECHCVDRYRLRDKTTPLPAASALRKIDRRPCNCVKYFEIFEEENSDVPKDNMDGQRICRCDCLTENKICERFKKGKEGFSVADRICIMEGRCTAPSCEYGQYSRRAGRCPRMEDKLANVRELSFN